MAVINSIFTRMTMAKKLVTAKLRSILNRLLTKNYFEINLITSLSTG